MESTPNLDALLGAIALIIVLGGLFMLLDGIKPLSQDSGKSRVKSKEKDKTP